MEKSQIESFVNALKSAGREDYALRIEGGNKTVNHKSESGMIYLAGDYAVCLETKNVHSNPTGSFNVHVTPYDMIDNAKAFNLTVKEALDFMEAIGGLDDEMKKFIATTGGRTYLQPGTAGMAERARIVDGEQEIIMPEQTAVHVTMGNHPPVVVEVVNTKEESSEGQDDGSEGGEGSGG